MSTRPETFVMDITGGNGTPFRFIYWPSTQIVVYFDRRYPTKPGEGQYKPFAYDENGQNCGPYLKASSFTEHRNTALTGWHGNREWDVDRSTRQLVSDWIEQIQDAYGLDLS
jgi:hypothetical protein